MLVPIPEKAISKQFSTKIHISSLLLRLNISFLEETVKNTIILHCCLILANFYSSKHFFILSFSSSYDLKGLPITL